VSLRKKLNKKKSLGNLQRRSGFMKKYLSITIAVLLVTQSAFGALKGVQKKAVSVKEAMACGVVVIGTDHAGIPELITDNANGLLVPENNIGEVVDRVERLMEAKDHWHCHLNSIDYCEAQTTGRRTDAYC